MYCRQEDPVQHFGTEAEREAFIRRLGSIRALLSGGEGTVGIDNFGLMSAMFDIVEGVVPTASAGNERQNVYQSFLRDSGKETVTRLLILTTAIRCVQGQ